MAILISSQAEVAIYNKLETQRVQAEMEVLEIRANNNQTKIKEIDDEIFQLFKSKVEDNEAVQTCPTWMGHVRNEENTVCNKWKKRIKDQKNIFKNEKSNKSADSIQAANVPETSEHLPPSPTTTTRTATVSWNLLNAVNNNQGTCNHKTLSAALENNMPRAKQTLMTVLQYA